ncbi:DUF1045 domain-containing protein [Roseovarius sp. PS-C2]|uniref:DUF1045 domain-containing protein n=1 Tax=Roseovarius sp. PS-C2 TaxID=2820814 RepID=UPI001C0CC0E5|nr:DUF1045 domain-containing protein [Roseovarius sp. PS-C2]MBU3261643.1 DUF1045 domain-containing protein [Roseovarius sp. PS-C2]
MIFKRYAIYYLPEPGPLAEFGAAWLGWDAASGQDMAHPRIDGLPLPAEQITDTPRKYGLHATIKPPFRLAPGTTENALNDALAAFCADQPAVTLDGLELAQLGRFLALRPEGDETALNALAANAVRILDAFRASMTEAELTHRRAANLNPEQDALLLQWGYPYVMESFRFHITLTGKLPKALARQTAQVLKPHLAPLLPQPFRIATLCLMGEAADGRFHLIARHELTG